MAQGDVIMASKKELERRIERLEKKLEKKTRDINDLEHKLCVLEGSTHCIRYNLSRRPIKIPIKDIMIQLLDMHNLKLSFREDRPPFEIVEYDIEEQE